MWKLKRLVAQATESFGSTDFVINRQRFPPSAACAVVAASLITQSLGATEPRRLIPLTERRQLLVNMLSRGEVAAMFNSRVLSTEQLRERLNRVYAAMKTQGRQPARFYDLWDLKELALMNHQETVVVPSGWLEEIERQCKTH